MKKHKLLREDILPAMATNRKVQRLLNEFMDLLSEYGISGVSTEQKTIATPTCPSLADQVDLAPSATNQMNPTPATVTDGAKTISAPSDQKEQNTLATDQANSAPPKINRVDLNSPFTDESNLSPQEKGGGS